MAGRYAPGRPALLDAILEQATDLILALDADGRLQCCNRRSLEVFGWRLEEKRGLPWWECLRDHFPGVAHSPAFDAFDAAARGIRVPPRDVTFRDGQGRLREAVLTASKAHGEGGTAMVAVTLADVTERKALERKIHAYATRPGDNEAERASQIVEAEKMAALGRLVAGVAHEINNPLAFVKSNLQTIAEVHGEIRENPEVAAALDGNADRLPFALAWLQASGHLGFAENEFPLLLERALAGVDRIQEVMGNLRVFAEPGAGRRLPTDLPTLLHDAVSVFRLQSGRCVEIVEDYTPVPIAWCDPVKINRVILNLLANAAEATEGKGCIAVRLRPAGQAVVISVEDGGRGIPREALPRIFEPFFTTREQPETGQPETGMGLSIAYALVREHGGEIQVRSRDGEGTLLSVVLPVRPPDAEPEVP